MNVVSLVPSITETLRAWGLDPVACTRYCEQPDLATVGGVKNPDIASIIAIAPDVVAMDRQENRLEDAQALAEAGIETVVLDVVDLAGLEQELSRLASAVGLSTPADGWPTATSDRPARSEGSPARRAFIPIWRRPWMTIGGRTYGSSMLDALGITNVFADHRNDYPTVDLADIAERAPDLVIVPSEPYEFSDEHLDELAAACPDARIARVDGQDLFWWGARTPAAYERLGDALAIPGSATN